MFQKNGAVNAYNEVRIESGVTDADPVQLIQMLLDGLIESMSVAEGHISRNAIAEKAAELSRAGRIVLGLQSALDYERGGKIAKTLGEFYGYLTRRLIHVHANNDIAALREIRGLVTEIRDAWKMVPSLVAPAKRPFANAVASFSAMAA